MLIVDDEIGPRDGKLVFGTVYLVLKSVYLVFGVCIWYFWMCIWHGGGPWRQLFGIWGDIFSFLGQLCVECKNGVELQEPPIVMYWDFHHQLGLHMHGAKLARLQKAKERQKLWTNWSLIPRAEKSYLSINNQSFLQPPVLTRYFMWTGMIHSNDEQSKTKSDFLSLFLVKTCKNFCSNSRR